jgi:ubiquinone/menaquinone biosynthesis C-methylase UbiE
MDKINQHTCPWWLIGTFDNPLRRWIHDPQKILAPYVQPGDTALDVGCGMGYFSLPMARLVGPQGKVICADLQPQMLEGLHRRAERAGLLGTLRSLQTSPERIGLDCTLDFALAFWMVHEVRQPEPFLREIFTALRPGGRLLVVEPMLHVSAQAFANTVILAQQVGFAVQEKPQVRASRAVLLRKKA